jgi:hypothetical protein
LFSYYHSVGFAREICLAWRATIERTSVIGVFLLCCIIGLLLVYAWRRSSVAAQHEKESELYAIVAPTQRCGWQSENVNRNICRYGRSRATTSRFDWFRDKTSRSEPKSSVRLVTPVTRDDISRQAPSAATIQRGSAENQIAAPSSTAPDTFDDDLLAFGS